MSNNTQSLGEQLVTLFEQFGVTTVFGIPGVHTIEIYRGLKASSIRHVTPRHEQGAGFMADGYARATGTVGVCLCITGPGMTNISTPMGQAFADSIPMLVISSVNKSNSLGKGLGHLHELKNQRELISGVAAFSHTLTNAEELPDVMARAYAVFNSARARPVHIEIPIDFLTLRVSSLLPALPPRPKKPAPEPATIERIVDCISHSTRIAVLIGGGCIEARESLREFVDLLGAPTCLTINARGLLPADHPLLLDGVQTIDAFRQYIRECDLCIAIGTELGQTDYDVYDTGALEPCGDFVRIDIDPEQLSNNVKPSIAMESDAALALEALCNSMKTRTHLTPKQNGSGIVKALNSALTEQFSDASKQYESLINAITTAQPNAIIVGDSTKPIYHANYIHRAPAPRHWFNSATGYGTLGYAMPAAIGAKLGKPNAAVVAIAGDGGFQFTLNELIVASQEGIGIAIVIWNNHAYREIQDYMEQNGIQPVGVDVQGPDLKLLAQAMRCSYKLANNMEEISRSLEPLLTINKPILIEYITDVDA